MGKYALLIGVETYGEGLQPLPAAPKDVAALQEVLLNPKMGGFDDAKPLINPTQSEMAREIELWFQGREPKDVLVLFFSGHGVKDDRRDLYFAACNTEKNRDRLVRSSATPARFIHDCIRGCRAKYQVIILDCCFSGAFGDLITRDDGEINLKEQLGAEGRVVLTSTSAVDYSFEEKGSDLSIYTRYLVEGIATGAADQDGDGIITVEELHRYAGQKVEQTSPAMSPKMIVLQDEGYRISLAHSPQDDPKLKYRKEVERRAGAGHFSIPATRLLLNLRAELKLSDVEAETIEAEVLKPFREYQRKRQEYQETLSQCLQSESPLSAQTIRDLKDYRSHLRLKPEDVVSIERVILKGNDLESYAAELERKCQKEEAAQHHWNSQEVYQRQWQQQEEWGRQRLAEAECQRQAAEMQRQITAAHQSQQMEDDLSSERFGANYYAKLKIFLVARDWKAADQETAERMWQVIDRQQEKWLRIEDIQKFPFLDLRNIDRLWVKYSEGRFGFSVQKKIWENCGSPTSYNTDWEKFGDAIGWKDPKGWPGWMSWYAYSKYMFNFSAPVGHLPSPRLESWDWVVVGGESVVFSSLLSRQDL